MRSLAVCKAAQDERAGSYTALFLRRSGPLICTEKETREPRPASLQSPWPISAEVPVRGSRPWNSRIECSGASIAARSLCSRQASRFFSTINNSRTTPSTASSARPSARADRSGCVRRRGPRVRSAAPRRQFPSSPLKAGRCCAAPASRGRAKRSPPKFRPGLLSRVPHPKRAFALRVGSLEPQPSIFSLVPSPYVPVLSSSPLRPGPNLPTSLSR